MKLHFGEENFYPARPADLPPPSRFRIVLWLIVSWWRSMVTREEPYQANSETQEENGHRSLKTRRRAGRSRKSAKRKKGIEQ
jgi:hypothetical protein